LARSTTISRSASQNDSLSVESVIEIVRKLWKSVEEEAEEPNRTKLKKHIGRTVNLLKGRIEKTLKASPRPLQGRLLLSGLEEDEDRPSALKKGPPTKPRFTDPVPRIYDKDLVEHALTHLPEAIKYSDIDSYRSYLTEKIAFNSQATRRRAAGYLIGRYFPGEALHRDLVEFAARMAGKPALSDALFYLTCRMEPIVALVADEVVFPSLPEGGVARSRVKEFVQSEFSGSKSVSDMSQAIIRTFERFGIGSATRTRLNVSLREGSLAAFGYVLHLEFPEPGMYSFERMFDGPMHKWLLWDQQWMVRQLYRLREAGLLSKVSEIDRLRQFTTKYTLAEAVQPIVALAKESPP
jgi:DNA repair protein RadC